MREVAKSDAQEELGLDLFHNIFWLTGYLDRFTCHVCTRACMHMCHITFSTINSNYYADGTATTHKIPVMPLSLMSSQTLSIK